MRINMNKIFMHLILAGSFFLGFFPAFSEAGLCPPPQDADIVAFLYREDYYKNNSEIPGITEIIISKNRNGPVGTVFLEFNKQFTHFNDTDYDSPENY